jgi:radical SAM protein with 4Fe4S-binding SPASM domain
MPEASPVLRAREPDFRDRRGGAQLLVWGERPDWLVVDDELAGFLTLFDGRRTLAEAVEAHGARGGDREEAERVSAELLRRGLLAEDLSPPPAAPEPVRIANVTFNLTNRCNLRCPWCYNAGRASAEIPPALLLRALREARGLLDPGASLILLGGEPFLDLPRLLEALDGAAGVFGPPPLVSTNGTLLSAEAVRALSRRRVEVQVSLDSHDPEVHDAARGPGVFRKALDGARRLADAGVRTILSMVYTRRTAGSFEPYLDLARAAGAAEARFIPLRRVGGGAPLGDLCPDQAESLENLLDVLERRPDLRPLLGRDWFSIAAATLRVSSPRRNCGIGRRVLFVDADGQVYPCPNHARPDHRCGSLRERGLEAIVRGSRVLRRIRARYDVSSYEGCGRCAFRQWCAGDCRGEVLAVSGDPFRAAPHCRELRRVYPRLLWLLATGDPRLGPRQDSRDRIAADAWR